MKNIVAVFCLALATLLTLGFSILTDGTLDTTFDSDGKAQVPVRAGSGNGIAIQSDGKIVVASYSDGAGIYQGIDVLRFNTNGTLDTGFSGDGEAVLQNPSAISGGDLSGIAVQPDGKIVVAGYGDPGGGLSWDFKVARLNTDGTLDTGFDGDGYAFTDINLADDRAYALALQADGKIVVTGYGQNGTDYDLTVVRYNSNGTLDTGFDGDGIVTTVIGYEAVGYSVAIQSDGKIVVGGYKIAASNADFMVARYNANGTLDNTFGTGGIATTAIGTGNERGRVLALQADEKIVLAGYTRGASNSDFALVRYNTNGTLDTGFDGDGKLTTAIGTDADSAMGMAIQLDGKIVVAGTMSKAANGYDNDFAVVRYNSNGTLDTGFDTDGKTTTEFGGENIPMAVAIQSDGKIVVTGYTYNLGTSTTVARYTGSSGPLPVEMVSFEGRASRTDAMLQWKTASELNNYGFEVERSSMINDESTINNEQWSKIGFVQGAGSSNSPREYSYIDNSPRGGTYCYRLKQIDRNGNFKYTESVTVQIFVPQTLTLSQNYPNPFNPSTTIEFTLPEDGRVSLIVYDILGKEVATLVNGELEAGVVHRATFDASQISSGIYFFRLEHFGKGGSASGGNGKQLMRKLLLIK